MNKELNTEWSRNLNGMRPGWTDSKEAARNKISRLVGYVHAESGGSLRLDVRSGHIIQAKTLPWEYIYDVIKNASGFAFIVTMAMPPRFKAKEPEPGRGTMYAYYCEEKDAVRLRSYTGKRREDLSGYDGWGREPDELEVVEGIRDKNGNWIEALDLKWI